MSISDRVITYVEEVVSETERRNWNRRMPEYSKIQVSGNPLKVPNFSEVIPSVPITCNTDPCIVFLASSQIPAEETMSDIMTAQHGAF